MPAGHSEQDQASTITHSFYMKFVYINRYAVIMCLKSSICLHERGRQRPLFFLFWPRWCKMRHFFWISWFRSVLVSFIIVPPVSADVQPICRASGEPRPRQSCRSDGSDWQSFYTQHTHTQTLIVCLHLSCVCVCKGWKKVRIESKPRARKEPGQVNPLNPQGINTVTLGVYVTSDLRPPHYCYVVKKLVNEKCHANA